MKKIKNIFILLILFILVQGTFSFATSDVANTPQTTDTTNGSITTYSPACLLMESSTGKILYEKNMDEVRYPASTTKIMTAILALEKCQLTDVATVSHDAIFTVPAGYTHANLREGEQLTIEQLLHALLIPSANDAANVIAEHISGSVSEFANLMNEKAVEIGCKNTHFVNPNGVFNKEHVSSAYDLALMGRYAMKNSTFREIVKNTKYTLPATEKYPKADRTLTTTNELLVVNNSSAKDNYYYPDAIGIKTGYTSEAGSCIVAGAQRDGLEVIVVVLGGESTKDGLSQRYLDCKTLFDYAFNNYSVKTVNEKDSVLQQVKVSGATKETKNLDVIVEDSINIFMENSKDIKSLQPQIEINKKLKAPIAKGATIGKITYVVDGETYTSNLLAKNNVDSSGFFPILIRIVLIIVTLYLIYVLLKPGKNRNTGSRGSKNTKSKNVSTKKKTTRKVHSKGGNYKFTQLDNLLIN